MLQAQIDSDWQVDQPVQAILSPATAQGEKA